MPVISAAGPLKEDLKKPPSQRVRYIQRVRVEAAKQKLEIGGQTVQDIMYEVGYADIQTFRDVFKDITGMTPLDYRNKYNREV